MQLSQKTLDKVQLYANKHLPLQLMSFSSDMKLRIMIAEQLFQAYSSGRVPMTRMPRKVIPVIAERVYCNILSNAPTDPFLAKLRDECQIVPGKKRTYFEMTNDIAVYEAFRHIWGIDTSNHAKAVVEEGAYQLIEMGVANQNERALTSGIDRLSKLHNNFQTKAEDYSNTASTEVDIIADARLVRADAENLSRQAIEDLKKKYGAYIDKAGGIETLIENEDGVYETAPDNDDDEKDYFETIEEEEFARVKQPR